LGAVPGWSFMSYLVISSANMSIISVIAKNRPGLEEASSQQSWQHSNT
jgi:hypothetical protein